MPNPPSRFAELDGLRGLAALMVALSHYVLAFQPAMLGGGPSVAHFAADQAIGHSPLILLYNPELGVAIFFVLSGFVLAASLMRGTASLALLVARRWVRLAVPVLGTSLLIWPLVEWHLFRSVEAAPLARSDWLAGNYAWVAHGDNDIGRLVWQSLVDLFARGRHFYNTALWTMPTEFWGSAALFAAYTLPRLIWGAGGWPPWLALAAALAVGGWQWGSAYAGFAWGAALFEAWRMLPRRGRVAGYAGGLLLAAGLVLGGMPFAIVLPDGGPYARLFLALAPWTANPVLLMHRLAAVFLVAASLLCPPLAALLRGEVCQFLGRVSFMLYLVHVPLLCAPIAALLLKLAPIVGYNIATDLLLPLFLGGALALAALCAVAIDEPAQRLSRLVGGPAPFRAWRPVRRVSPPATNPPSP